MLFLVPILFSCLYVFSWISLSFKKAVILNLFQAFHTSPCLWGWSLEIHFFWWCHVWFFATWVVLHCICTSEGANSFLVFIDCFWQIKDLLHPWADDIIFWATVECCWSWFTWLLLDMWWGPCLVVLLRGAQAHMDPVWSLGGQDYIQNQSAGLVLRQGSISGPAHRGPVSWCMDEYGLPLDPWKGFCWFTRCVSGQAVLAPECIWVGLKPNHRLAFRSLDSMDLSRSLEVGGITPGLWLGEAGASLQGYLWIYRWTEVGRPASRGMDVHVSQTISGWNHQRFCSSDRMCGRPVAQVIRGHESNQVLCWVVWMVRPRPNKTGVESAGGWGALGVS